MKARCVIAYIAFALLLLSQQLGMAHAISHITSETTSSSSQKESLPGDLQCEQCLAFAALGTGLTGAPPLLAALIALTDTAVAILLVKALPAPLRAFNSRAPPVLI